MIGLTVVAFGTSAPELAVSVQAGLAGQADIAAGNIVGSNIFNVLFILGVSALIVPLVVSQQLVRLDVPIMIGVSVLLLVVALDGRTSRLDGLLLFSGIVAYTVFAIRQGRRESPAVQTDTRRSSVTAAACGLTRIFQCAVQRRCLSAGANPARQLSLQPVAIGATMEVTKSLKPSV